MIKIYTTTTCAYCKMVKKFLSMKGKDFEEINLDEHPEKVAEATEISGGTSVPITTNGAAFVVGWSPAKLMEIL